MSGKNFFWVSVLGITGFVSAAVLVPQATPPHTATIGTIASVSDAATPGSTDTATGTKAASGDKPKTVQSAQSSAPKAAGARETVIGPRFVELKLNHGQAQSLSGRAPKGTQVQVFKGAAAIGTATTGRSGVWALALNPPITDRDYVLSLKGVAQEGDDKSTAEVSQIAVVSVTEAGRARISIQPPETAELLSQIPGLPTTLGSKKVAEKPATESTAKTKQAKTKTTKAEKPAGAVGTAQTKTGDPTPAPESAEAVDDPDGTLEQATRMAEAATEKFTDVVGKEKKSDSGADPALTDAQRVLEFTDATLDTRDGERPTVNLAGKSAPGAELGLFVGDQRIAGTIAKPDGRWSMSKSITTGAAPLRLRIDQFDAKGTVVASAARIARRSDDKEPGRIAVPEPATGDDTTKTADAGNTAADGSPATASLRTTAQNALKFNQATLEAADGARPTVKLSGKSIPGADLGLFVGKQRIAITSGRADGSWSFSKSITTGAAPLTLRIDQFDADGKVIASASRIARRPRSKDLATIKVPKVSGNVPGKVSNSEQGGATGAGDTAAPNGTTPSTETTDTGGSDTATTASNTNQSSGQTGSAATGSTENATSSAGEKTITAEEKALRAKRAAKRRTAAQRVAAARLRAKNRARARARRQVRRTRSAQRTYRRQAQRNRRLAKRRLRRRASRHVIRRDDNTPIDVRVMRLNRSFNRRRRGIRATRRARRTGTSRYIRRWRP